MTFHHFNLLGCGSTTISYANFFFSDSVSLSSSLGKGTFSPTKQG